MTILRTDTLSGIGTEGTVLEGNITIDSLNYMTLPKGTTSQRYSLEGRDPDYHKLKLHLPLVHHTQFDDYSPASPSITANYDSHISSKSGVFEHSAALFSRQGSNDWLYYSDSTDNDLGSDDFTIECWFMCTVGGTNGYLVQKGTTSGNWSYFIQFREATDSINFYGTSDGTNFDIVNGTSFGSPILPNKWYHVAVCRSGNTFSYYINGQKGATTDTSSASFHNSNVDVRIPESGGFGATEEVFLQDVRLYKGVAKYNETFIPQKLAEDGAIRYNTDSNKIECYNGTKWMNISVSSPDLGGNGNASTDPTGNSADQVVGVRGLFGGGFVPSANTNVIQYITVSSTGNAIDFGNLTDKRRGIAACASSTRAVFGGGIGPSISNILDFVTIASTGDAQDFGDLQTALRQKAALSSATRGIFSGGYTTTPSTSFKDEIDHFTIASTGHAKDFGNLSGTRGGHSGCSSSSRGLFVGGTTPSGVLNVIDFITISSLGDAEDFGDLTGVRAGAGVCSNSIKGLFGGGYDPANLSVISEVNIASKGGVTTFGNLIAANKTLTALSSSTRAVFGGGLSDVIQYVAFATEGNAVDFGDLLASNQQLSATSNAHGGL